MLYPFLSSPLLPILGDDSETLTTRNRPYTQHLPFKGQNTSYTGAIPNAISAAFVKAKGLALQSSPCCHVQLANGTSPPVLGSAHVEVEVQGVKLSHPLSEC